ncbi:MAG: metallophosphoesterase [Candidatus Aminicenantes bacterium]|nr:metallophosphoesterase [Candidatus Aminicenantes bacterium]
MKRREFLKTAAVPILLGSGINVKHGFCEGKSLALDNEYPFPYDDAHFEAGERVVYTSPLRLHLNILPKEGKKLDIKISFSGGNPFDSTTTNGTRTFYGVEDNLDLCFVPDPSVSLFKYRLEYKEIQNTRWLSTPERRVKSMLSFNDEKEFNAILIGDDHTPDDADSDTSILEDQKLRELRLNGDYVGMFMKKLLADPQYFPDPSGEEWKLLNGFTLASTLLQIHNIEKPDLIIHLGDHRGGFGHKWPGLGLKNQHNVTDDELAEYMKIFRIGTRKIFSILSPEIPIYWALGNHDGEAGYHHFLNWATFYRKKYFKLPGFGTGNSPEENYYSLIWGCPDTTAQEGREGTGIKLVFCDSERYNLSLPRKPKDWTLGETQRRWLEKILDNPTAYTFIFFHHVLGGWPAGTHESITDTAYGRGPLFTSLDYKGLVSNPESIEQVGLTRLFKNKNVDAVIYGHDHIFNVHAIGNIGNGKTLYGICSGSPKYNGEIQWYKGDLWKSFYGEYGDYGGNSSEADFWGPAGYTRLTIGKNGARVDYVRSAHNHPKTNIPYDLQPGDIIASFIL